MSEHENLRLGEYYSFYRKGRGRKLPPLVGKLVEIVRKNRVTYLRMQTSDGAQYLTHPSLIER